MASTPWIVKEPNIQTLIRALEQSRTDHNQKLVAETLTHDSANCQLKTNGQLSRTRDSTSPPEANGRAVPDNSATVINDPADPPESTQVAEPHDTQSTQDRNDIRIDPYLRSTLDAYYCAFRKIGDARAIYPQFDELCDIHRDIWQQLSKPKNHDLVNRIRDFRVQYESDMTIVRETEKGAVDLMYSYVQEECRQQWSPYTNGLIDKVHDSSRRLHKYLSDKEQHGMQTLNNITKFTGKNLMGYDRAQKLIEAKFENAGIAITRHLFEQKYRRVAEERDKQLGDARGLCAYVATRNRKDTAGLVDKLKKSVLDGILDDILESYTSKAANEFAPILQHIATHIRTQRVEALRNIISENSQRLIPIQLITSVYSDMKATKIRLEAIASQGDEDTVDGIQTKVVVLKEQVTQAMRSVKRLRQDQILLSNARKKARLCSVERKVDQLEKMIDEAKRTVLSETFPVQANQAVTEVYEVLNNHGEFIRRLVDPVAAKNDEQIDKSHLDTISTLHDGLTFPLRFSIEKLAQNAAQDAFGGVMERLDILEKKVV